MRSRRWFRRRPWEPFLQVHHNPARWEELSTRTSAKTDIAFPVLGVARVTRLHVRFGLQQGGHI
jgi:hypothetical protein